MVNKEECLKALDYFFEESFIEDFANPTDLKNYYILEQLIEEHFSNEPLKFEELKKCMWVWDSKYDEYIQINYVTPRKEIEVYIPSYIDGDFQGIYVEEFKFEENRYYRKQVGE